MESPLELINEYFKNKTAFSIQTSDIVYLLHKWGEQVFELAQRPTIGTTYRMDTTKWEFEYPDYNTLSKDFDE